MSWLGTRRGSASLTTGRAVQGTWANMKCGLGNLAAADADQLTAIIKNRLKSIEHRPAHIDAFLAQTGLRLEPQPP